MTELDAAERALLAEAGLRGELTVSRLSGGFSNRMHRIADNERAVVLRRWRNGAGAAGLELAALREAALDGIPVPEVLAADGELAVLAEVPGEPASVVLAECTPAEAEVIGERIGALFAEVWTRKRHTAGLALPEHGPLRFEPWPSRPSVVFTELLAEAHAAPPGWTELAADYADTIDEMLRDPVRSHSDANPKNVLLRRGSDGYTVTALLDWEFTCAAPAEHDLGNLLRFEPLGAALGPFGAGIVRGCAATAEQVTLARRLDLFALAEFFSRASIREHGMYPQLYELAERQLTSPP